MPFLRNGSKKESEECAPCDSIEKLRFQLDEFLVYKIA